MYSMLKNQDTLLYNSKFLFYIFISVPLLETEQVISQVFPLHSTDDLMELRETWMQKFFNKQPLGKEKDILTYTSLKMYLEISFMIPPNNKKEQ